ncbi:trichohyalin-like isoform X2 [Alosa sapidissima]|uniref:trichohyalin-like isoform X2 n=2 Tax=Alosa sapidissima TaxID=34773 RepID=UPI001C09609F|nr:trichohyalin-like isoform X2 [Alosa sapidissima]XP_041926504.1 trichohyalin-like isoform X2 [Alosa sapidissima]XP_041926512.1 trichohyalin-like isoform X2 [Alosa sapidissima]XP_041926521.1 trichohyalin-like isoform X2 [Alosa sapidissima]XP_041926530.1 trichohyalin-like isoform X2 [Alosa sapidissima]XP_041926535.1 trichohyalin-like isoform X2 [Alosa sapidissima]XP_041926536.1 trichohyalin-like isoform X2 [Alosa sapidissima]XP_041926540.1 trichohyalin-like isoform X2 [Alosa sapidissima]
MATASKHKSKSIKFTLVSISREVQIHPGDDITLPCHLSPEASAVAMEIRWFKGTDCIYLYRKPYVHVQTSFKGRLATKTLKKGDVSLTMKKSTWGDAGQYTCQVIHGEEKEEQTVALQFDDQGETGVICPDFRKITDRHEKQMEESVRAIEEVSRQLREERKKHEAQLIQETQKAYKLAHGAKLNKKMAKALAYQRAEGRGKQPNSKEMLRCDYEEGRRREAERKSTNSKQQEEVGETQRENRQDNVTSLLRQVLSLETELQMRNSEVQELRTQLQDKERGDRHNQVERHKQRERREHLNVGGESPGPAPPVSPAVSELRLVLLGGSTAGKRAAGNTILGTNTLTETQHSKSRQGEVAGRRVTTVETPDWFCSGLSEKDMRKDVGLCVRLSAPGPHAFLLLMPMKPSEGEERRMLEKMEDIFGEGCWGHTLILFTHAEGLRERSVEELLQTGSQELQQLVEKCGNRCHLLNVKDRPDDTKITQLLEKIEEMVSGNRERFYSSETYQEAERQLREIERRMQKEREVEERKDREERERKVELDKIVQKYLKKMDREIQKHKRQIRTVHDKTTELEKKINEANDEKQRAMMQCELQKEIAQKEEMETNLNQMKEKKEKELREMEEIRESYEREARTEAERKLMKIIFSELQRNISFNKEMMEGELNRQMEEKNRGIAEKKRELEETKQQMEEKSREFGIILQELRDKGKAIDELTLRQCDGDKRMEVAILLQDRIDKDREIERMKEMLNEKDREMERMRQILNERERQEET